MVEEIGAVAGQVWNYLSENGEVSLPELKKGLDISQERMMHWAVGWLAREGKITISVLPKNKLVIALK